MTPDSRPDTQRHKEDRELLVKFAASHDPALREQLVERFLPLARQLARRYERSDEQFEDLFQVASLGLVKAIDRFDPERPVAFSSYAVPTILGEIKRHFRDKTWSVRVPRDLKETSLRVDSTVTELNKELGRQPSVGQIAERLDLSEEQVLEALQAGQAYRATSLQTPRGDDDDAGATLGDTLGGDDDQFDVAEDRATLDALMRNITPRERDVLRLRFVEDLTQAEIGERIGVSQMQVSRIIRGAIARLRQSASD